MCIAQQKVGSFVALCRIASQLLRPLAVQHYSYCTRGTVSMREEQSDSDSVILVKYEYRQTIGLTKKIKQSYSY